MRGGKPQQLCEGGWELLWLLFGPRGGGRLLLPGSIGPLFRWRGPRACTFWNGEVLGMCAPWICVRPGALLLRIGRHVFGAGWRKLKEIPGWCRPRVAPPPHNGSPLAITSILLSSCRLRRVLVVTLAPASRQTLAAALSKRIPRPRKTPAWAHAARWSPNGSKMRRHRQMRADRGSGRRRRRRSRTRKR